MTDEAREWGIKEYSNVTTVLLLDDWDWTSILAECLGVFSSKLIGK